MESYTLIFVRDSHSRPQQISVPKARVKQLVIGVAVVSLIFVVANIEGTESSRLEHFDQRVGGPDS